MNRNAAALWKGSLHEGKGTLTTESGVLSQTQYSYGTRFAEGIGTNPDELIAASLGGCFSMALSNELGLCGYHPQRIETVATATLEDLAAGWTVTHMQLDVHAKVPDASQANFDPAPPNSVDEIFTAFDASLKAAEEYLCGVSESALMENWRLTFKGREVFSMPPAGVLRSIMLNHWYHHRGQLTVYLRMVGARVPAVYGSSADENPMAART